MTREQAIDILKNTAWLGTDNDREQTEKAVDMAISALEQEPCDAISIRKDALKTRVGNIVAYNVKWLKEHWQMEMDIVCGVKPCDDAISRSDVDAQISEWVVFSEYIDEENRFTVKKLHKRIQELPSVQPSIDLDKHDEALIKETVANIWGKEPSRMTSMEKGQIRKLQERKAELIDEFIGRCEEINYQIKAIRNGKWKIVPVEDEEEE